MRTKNIFIVALFSVLIIFALGQFPASVKASKDDNVYGYAWSSTIGWISFNSCISGGSCGATDYGVKLDKATGALSGYAWSSNLGYISFDYSDGSHPSAKASGSKITGWARACSVFASGCTGTEKSDVYLGGWDGWINLDPAYGGVTVDATGGINSFAWGSDVIGWTEFKLNTDTAITVNLWIKDKLQDKTIKKGDSAYLTWDSSGATSCEATTGNFSTGADKATSNSTGVQVSPTINTTYIIKCTNGSAVATDSVKVNVEIVPIPPIPASCPAVTVTRALFGVGRYYIVVTRDVKNYIESGELFDASMQFFKDAVDPTKDVVDPAPGRIKTLDITYTFTGDDGKTKIGRNYYTEGTQNISINKMIDGACVTTKSNANSINKIIVNEN